MEGLDLRPEFGTFESRTAPTHRGVTRPSRGPGHSCGSGHDGASTSGIGRRSPRRVGSARSLHPARSSRPRSDASSARPGRRCTGKREDVADRARTRDGSGERRVRWGKPGAGRVTFVLPDRPGCGKDEGSVRSSGAILEAGSTRRMLRPSSTDGSRPTRLPTRVDLPRRPVG